MDLIEKFIGSIKALVRVSQFDFNSELKLETPPVTLEITLYQQQAPKAVNRSLMRGLLDNQADGG